MSLTEEQKTKLNARASQNGTGMNTDYDEYQEFLRFKEMKAAQSRYKQETVVKPPQMNMISNNNSGEKDKYPEDLFLWIIAFMPIGYLFVPVLALILTVIVAILDLVTISQRGYTIGFWCVSVVIPPVYVIMRSSETNNTKWPVIIHLVSIGLIIACIWYL